MKLTLGYYHYIQLCIWEMASDLASVYRKECTKEMFVMYSMNIMEERGYLQEYGIQRSEISDEIYKFYNDYENSRREEGHILTANRLAPMRRVYDFLKDIV